MKDGSQTDCCEWDYETHLEAACVAKRCDRLMIMLASRPRIFKGYSTLRVHRYMFRGLTPDDCKYFAGNYRGSDFRCLKDYRVTVGGDSRVGTLPQKVAFEMSLFEAQLKHAVQVFAKDLHAAGSFNRKLLLSFTDTLAQFLVYFFTIHPYANGNGHTGRLIILVLLKRFNLEPIGWPLDDRPDYGGAIRAYRNGDRAPLRDFILNKIKN